MMYKIMAVAFGGSVGAVARYLVFLLVGRYYTGVFPWASLIVNLSGAFIIGFLWGLFDGLFVLLHFQLLLSICLTYIAMAR